MGKRQQGALERGTDLSQAMGGPLRTESSTEENKWMFANRREGVPGREGTMRLGHGARGSLKV